MQVKTAGSLQAVNEIVSNNSSYHTTSNLTSIDPDKWVSSQCSEIKKQLKDAGQTKQEQY